jgi:Domain of unknown function (DUF4062)
MPAILISCVTDEFKDHRTILDTYLRRAKLETVIQEHFGQEAVDTLEKLDNRIKECDAVVHLIGEKSGSVAAPQQVRRLLARFNKEGRPFLGQQSEALRSALGNFADLTYTEWEAFLALHHKKPLYVYATAQGKMEQEKRHCTRLGLGDPKRYVEAFISKEDLFPKVLADLGSFTQTLSAIETKNKILKDWVSGIAITIALIVAAFTVPSEEAHGSYAAQHHISIGSFYDCVFFSCTTVEREERGFSIETVGVFGKVFNLNSLKRLLNKATGFEEFTDIQQGVIHPPGYSRPTTFEVGKIRGSEVILLLRGTHGFRIGSFGPPGNHRLESAASLFISKLERNILNSELDYSRIIP